MRIQKCWNRITLVLVGLGMFSCLETELGSADVDSPYSIVYLSNNTDISNFSNDPYRIVAITPYDDRWDVIVEYTGGCGEHTFYLWWKEQQIGYFNDQSAELFLIHNGNDDECEALIRDTVSFSLAEVFEGSYPEEGSKVTIRNIAHQQSITVDPYVAALTTENCGLDVEVRDGLCGIGSWGSTWIHPVDSVPFNDDVWFQPVRVSSELDSREIKVGTAEVSVTLLFGFQFIQGGEGQVNCDNWPEGTVVPVSVKCLYSE